ncbi:DUF5683 domain-containing protein [Mucilaginibacter litoreus]|uniref:DUF5683 domain-containing protein n=1 Tax=Mucilaginibacter litoreus TaxID=1048221 RepID=A0ABW3AV09_9SPHI
MLKKTLLTVLFTAFALFAMAQRPDSLAKPKADTAGKSADTVKRPYFKPKITNEPEYHPDSTHSPSLAVKRSLFIPGWGQLYNRQGWWWKVPAIYAGLGALGYSIIDSHKNYKMFLALARIKNTGGIPTEGKPFYAEYQKYKTEYAQYSNATFTQLQEAASNYQRNFQISIGSVILVWGVQVVEAYVTAKFINAYTVDNNLSMKVSPTLINNPLYAGNFSGAYIPGLKVTFGL